MRQAGAALKLVSSDESPETGKAATGASDRDTVVSNRDTVANTSITQEGRQSTANDDAVARGARHDLLKEWMGSHTRILGLWLDRLLEEGDDGELISMIHRQHAWLSMMQVRMERG